MSSSRTFTYIAALIFAVMGVVHLYRVISPFPVNFGSVAIPMWVSYIGIVVGLGLGWMLCREARGRPTA